MKWLANNNFYYFHYFSYLLPGRRSEARLPSVIVQQKTWYRITFPRFGLPSYVLAGIHLQISLEVQASQKVSYERANYIGSRFHEEILIIPSDNFFLLAHILNYEIKWYSVMYLTVYSVDKKN